MWTRRWRTYRCLPVLDRQLHGDPQTLPVTGGLGNVITNFLGRLLRKQWTAEISRWKQDLNVWISYNLQNLHVKTYSFSPTSRSTTHRSLKFVFHTLRHRVAHWFEQTCFLKLGWSEPPLDYTQSLWQTGIVAGGWFESYNEVFEHSPDPEVRF